MTFGEYLMAIDKNDLYQSILKGQVNEYQSAILGEEVKKYFFIGGMPNAVKTYVLTKSFIEVRKVQSEILVAYLNDFPKYKNRINIERITAIFKQIPFHLGKKLIYQHLDRGSKGHDIKTCIELLIRANLIVPSFHSNASGLPLKSTLDTTVVKMFFLDIGLVNCLHEFNWHDFQELYEKSFVTKGFLAEQFVSQHLSNAFSSITSPETIHWLRDKSSKKAEIDFLVSYKNKILPIEVKAQKGRSLKSLILFSKEKNVNKAIKFSKEWFHSEEILLENKQTLKVQNWPFYCIENFIKKIK